MEAPAASCLVLLLLLVLPSARAATPARSSSSSSAVFQLQGDVYPTGHYYVTMSIGDPAKPYFLDVDTGSDLTWLQCDAPCQSCNKVPHPLYKPTKNKLVPCADSLCTTLHSAAQSSNKKCTTPQQCDYQIKYTDSASSLGVLVADNFTLPLRNSSSVRASLTFGCGYDQQVGKNGVAQAATDGLLGLGRGSISLLSQLKQRGVTKNVLGHCLGASGGGFLFFGDDVVPTSRATWVPMVRSTSGNYYSPGSGTLYFDKRSLGVKPMEMVFDSGSTYTYFAAQPYQATVSALKAGLSKSLQQVTDPSLPLCWKGQKVFKSVSDVKKDFKSLFLNFAKNAVMEITPENYLIVTKNGNVCLGILDGSAAKLSFNIIGDITMQDQLVIYDNERGQLGWIRGSCSRSTKREYYIYCLTIQGKIITSVVVILLVLPHENHLVVTNLGNVCVGILDGSSVPGLDALNLILIGDVTMQDLFVIYDNDSGQLGWVRAPGNRLRESESVISSRL